MLLLLLGRLKCLTSHILRCHKCSRSQFDVWANEDHIVVDFVVDSSLAIGGIAIRDYSNGPEEVVVDFVVVVVVVVVDFVVVFVAVVVVVFVIKVKMANCTYSSVS